MSKKWNFFFRFFFKKKYYRFIELKKLIELAPRIGSWIPVLTEIGFNDFLEILKNEQKLQSVCTWESYFQADSDQMDGTIGFSVKNWGI